MHRDTVQTRRQKTHFPIAFKSLSGYWLFMEIRPPWPHAPSHCLADTGTFIVTAATYKKQHFFAGGERLQKLQDQLLDSLLRHGYQIEAWACFSNHYHFVARTPSDAMDARGLSGVLGGIHQQSALCVNRLENTPGRKVWHNFWETRLTFQKSYLARLRYVHENAVHHGLVHQATDYPWCSAAWFEQTAAPSLVRSIYSFRIDRLNVADEYAPAPAW